MTPHRLVAIAFLLAVPLSLNGQGRRGTGTGGGTGAGTGGGGGPAGGPIGSATPATMMGEKDESAKLAKDLESANPIQALLDARKSLKLTADEEQSLRSINKQLKSDIRPFVKRLDSVVVAAKYRSATDSAMAKLAVEHREPAKNLLLKESARRAARRDGRPPV